MNYDVLYINKDFKIKNFEGDRFTKETAKMTPLAKRLLDSAQNEVFFIFHFHKNGKLAVDKGAVPGPNTYPINPDYLDNPWWMSMKRRGMWQFLKDNDLLNETGYLIIVRNELYQKPHYISKMYFIYTEKVIKEDKVEEVVVLPKDAKMYVCTAGNGEDYQIKLFKDNYEVTKQPENPKYHTTKLFSELRNELEDSPVEIKKAFNNLVTYFNNSILINNGLAFEFKDFKEFLSKNGNDPLDALVKVKDINKLKNYISNYNLVVSAVETVLYDSAGKVLEEFHYELDNENNKGYLMEVNYKGLKLLYLQQYIDDEDYPVIFCNKKDFDIIKKPHNGSPR